MAPISNDRCRLFPLCACVNSAGYQLFVRSSNIPARPLITFALCFASPSRRCFSLSLARSSRWCWLVLSSIARRVCVRVCKPRQIVCACACVCACVFLSPCLFYSACSLALSLAPENAHKPDPPRSRILTNAQTHTHAHTHTISDTHSGLLHRASCV